jgi:cobalt-zinc-cadmium efflux system outer membrane protein
MRILLSMTVVALLFGVSSPTWARSTRTELAASPIDVRSAVSALPASRRAQLDVAPPLTVRAALDEALARNPRLIVLRREYEALLLRPAQALALAPPSFEAQIWQWPFNTLSPANTNMYMFTVGQALPGRGKRALRAAVAEKNTELARAVIAVEAHDVVNEVKRVYADLFLARREREIHDANIDLLRQFADMSEAKYVTGRMSQQDLLKAVVEVSRLHEDLVTLDERERLAAARLNTLLDRPPESAVGRLVEPREGVPQPALAALQRSAVERQPELLALRVDIERAEATRASQRREYEPDYFVKGGYFLMPGQSDSWTAMVGVTWPKAPWARSGIDARVAEAAAAVETARARNGAAASAVRLAVHEAYVRIEAAQERAALLRTSIVPQSDQTLAVSRVAYQADQGDFLTLIDNQRVLLDAQRAYYRALSDLEQARADLERAVGTDRRFDVTAGRVAPPVEATSR